MFTLKWKQLQCVVSGCTVSPFPLQSPGASCRLSLVRPSMFICLWRSMYGERGGRIGPCSPIHEATEWPLLPILTPPSHCFVHHNGGNHVLSVFCILVCSSWWVIEGEKFQISMTKKNGSWDWLSEPNWRCSRKSCTYVSPCNFYCKMHF